MDLRTDTAAGSGASGVPAPLTIFTNAVCTDSISAGSSADGKELWATKAETMPAVTVIGSKGLDVNVGMGNIT